MSRALGLAALAAYVATILLANWLVARFGVVAVGFGLQVPAAVFAAGAAFTLRDLTHRLLGRTAVLAGIAAGTALSLAPVARYRDGGGGPPLLPTPRVAADRSSRRALVGIQHWSAVALGQAAELLDGVLPREFEHADELTPQARRLYEHGLLPTPMARDHKGADMPGREGGRSLGQVAAGGHWPTPEASGRSGGRVSSELGGERPSGSKRAVTLASAVAHRDGLVPTPVASDARGARNASLGRRNGHDGMTLTDHVRLWPTPRGSSGSSRSGGGEGGTYYRTPSQEAGTHGLYLQSEVCEAEAAAGGERGPLNPRWVEWLMGFPGHWTDPAADALEPHTFSEEPLPRTARGVEHRRARLTALGNALVPHVAAYVAARAGVREGG